MRFMLALLRQSCLPLIDGTKTSDQALSPLCSTAVPHKDHTSCRGDLSAQQSPAPSAPGGTTSLMTHQGCKASSETQGGSFAQAGKELAVGAELRACACGRDSAAVAGNGSLHTALLIDAFPGAVNAAISQPYLQTSLHIYFVTSKLCTRQ